MKTIDAETVQQLNDRAQELYRTATGNETDGYYSRAAQSAMLQAAEEAGLARVTEDINDSSHTVIFQDVNGAIVNCWMSAPSENFYAGHFDNVGFDTQVEWHVERD